MRKDEILPSKALKTHDIFKVYRFIPMNTNSSRCEIAKQIESLSINNINKIYRSKSVYTIVYSRIFYSACIPHILSIYLYSRVMCKLFTIDNNK